MESFSLSLSSLRTGFWGQSIAYPLPLCDSIMQRGRKTENTGSKAQPWLGLGSTFSSEIFLNILYQGLLHLATNASNAMGLADLPSPTYQSVLDYMASSGGISCLGTLFLFCWECRGISRCLLVVYFSSLSSRKPQWTL